jgi:hypothetical protein
MMLAAERLEASSTARSDPVPPVAAVGSLDEGGRERAKGRTARVGLKEATGGRAICNRRANSAGRLQSANDALLMIPALG